MAKKQKQIMDIAGLAESLAEVLKEISTGGNSLTLAKMTTTLAKRKDISALLERANDRSGGMVTDEELDSLKSIIEAGENKRREILHQVSALQGEFSREKEFYRRLIFAVMNLARIPENMSFYQALDKCRSQMQEGAELECLEASLKNIKDLMLQEGIGGSRKIAERFEKSPDSENRPGVSIVKSFFGRAEKPPAEDLLSRLKSEGCTALAELQAILGEEYRASVHLAQEYIDKSRDLDFFISQKTYILSVIEAYVKRATREKEQLTGFIREVSERLLEMEKEMAATSSATQDVRIDAKNFSENLESELRTFQDTVLGSKDFDNLKTFVVSQLTKISSVLQKRREEYTISIEKAQKESESLKKNFKNLIGRVIDKNKNLMEEIQRDPLTEIFNRRTFETSIAAELDRFHRYKKPFTFIFFDVDFFKRVNDRYGHDAGDRVLKAIARKVTEVLRKPDVFARYGGEEFVIILPETSLDNGQTVAMKIREMIEDTVFEYEGERVPITISLGVTEVEPGDLEPSHIALRADKLLYRAKAEGRNKVVSDYDVR